MSGSEKGSIIHLLTNTKTSDAQWRWNDTLFVIAMFLGTVLSRLPFRATLLNSHDAVNYALALDHFDMRLHQPHPPGYVLYILIGRAFNAIFHDHLTALLWLSIISSGLAVVAVYLAGRAVFARRVGVKASLLLAVSSTFWLLGELALPYTADLFASAIMGWLCYRLMVSSEQAIACITALVLGLSGAFRPQTFVFLFPLFLYALYQSHRSWKTIVGVVILAVAVFGAFFVPSVMVSGGLSAFVRSMRSTVPIFWSKDTLVRSAKLSRYVQNADTILRYMFRVMGELGTLFVLMGYFTRPNWLKFWRNLQLRFLAIWVAPTWLVYLLIWPGNLGTIFVCMAPLFLLAALGLDWIVSRPRYGTIVGRVIFLGVLVWSVVVFILFPSHPFGENYRRFDSYESVITTNTYYRARLTLVADLPTDGTIVYGNAFRHLQYYLPAYHAFSFPILRRSDPTMVKSAMSIENGRTESWSNIETADLIPTDTERIVFFDLPPELALVDPDLIETRARDGQIITIISVPPNCVAQWTRDGLTLQSCNN